MLLLVLLEVMHVVHVVLDLSFHQNEEIFVKTAVFFLHGKNNRQFKDTKRERRKRRRSCFNVEIKKTESISSCLE